MVKFPPQLLEQIKDALPVSRVVGARVPLRKQGNTLVGCCPFHKEKTPSFHVNDVRQSYHCFGCGAHGDVIRFLTEYEGMSFPEAVERLAGEAGIPLPQPRAEDRVQAARIASQYEVLELAARWFEQQLFSPMGESARDYLKGRGLTGPIAKIFRLGYAPDARDGLKKYLASQNVPEQAMLAAGLVIQPESGGTSYDRFRGRVMFPIENSKGKVIAFGGRILGAGEPKYLNSPETDLFSKSHTLYNLHRARKAAHDLESVIAVEGYMDVIALAAGGITNAVAPLGTAMTEHHLRLLWQMAPEPVICLDGDAAGFKAMARVTELALPMLKPGLSFRFALLPEGDDPDTLIRRLGADATRALLDKAQPLAEMLWHCHTQGKHLDTPEQKAALEDTLMQDVARIADRTVQNHYRDFLRAKLWEMRRSLQSKGGQAKGGAAAPTRHTPQRLEAQAEIGGAFEGGADSYLERLLLAVIVAQPSLLERAEVEETLATLPLASDALEPLRRALLDLAHEEELSVELLNERLSAHGLDVLADGLDNIPGVKRVKPGIHFEEAHARWSEIMARYENQWEQQKKEQELKDEEESLRISLALKAGGESL